MLLLAILVSGLFVGWLAQLILRRRRSVDWALALVAGLTGSWIGGLLASLLSGDGMALRPSGLIGSFVGAVAVTILWSASPSADPDRR